MWVRFKYMYVLYMYVCVCVDRCTLSSACLMRIQFVPYCKELLSPSYRYTRKLSLVCPTLSRDVRALRRRYSGWKAFQRVTSWPGS